MSNVQSKIGNVVRYLIYVSPFIFPLYLLRFQVYGIPLTALELFAYALFILWFFAVISGQIRLSWNRPLRYYWLAGFMLFLGATIGVLVAPHYINLPSGELLDAQRAALGVWKGWIVAPLLYFAVLSQTLMGEKEAETLSRFFVCSGAVVGLAAYGFALFNSGITYDLRLSGFFESANYLSLYLVPPILLGVMLLFRRPARLNWFHYLDLPCLAIMVHALLFTRSYAAILSVFAALFLFFFLQTVKNRLGRKGWIALFIIILTFGLIVITQVNTSKFRQTLDWEHRSSTSVRLEIYEVAWSLIRENPLTGIGPGLFQAEYQTRGRENLGHVPMEWNIPHPHNIFFAFWLNAGLLGLLAFLLLLGLAHSRFTYPLVAFWGIVIHGLFDAPFWKNDLSMMFWLVIVLILTLQSHGAHSPQITGHQPSRTIARPSLRRHKKEPPPA